MTTQAIPSWKIRGTVVLACNCDYGCPCNFNARPTHGDCEGGWSWNIREGNYGDVLLDGLNFSLFADWPAAIHEGNGVALALIDERADERQREVLTALLEGRAGGPWGILANTISDRHGPQFVTYEFKDDGVRSSLRAGSSIELVMQPIKNPVSGAEVFPRAVLPQGFIWKDGAMAASTTFRVQNGITFDHSGKYAAVAEFEYSGP